jgi:diaminopimelate epimerase
LKYTFYKYQGTGNDFIMLDGRSKKFVMPSEEQINKLCHRQFGIGADGLIVILKHKQADFEMLYFNADGKPGSLCGNGGRCTIAFAKQLGIIKNKTKFMAYDGLHVGSIDIKSKLVTLKMNDVKQIASKGDAYELNTGSPHYVVFNQEVKNLDVFKEGRKIRNSKSYRAQGINVNFVAVHNNALYVRTYERGVENETLSCGTGITAASIAFSLLSKTKKKYNIPVETLGGALQVSFKTNNHTQFTDIYLTGPAHLVYSGEINI